MSFFDEIGEAFGETAAEVFGGKVDEFLDDAFGAPMVRSGGGTSDPTVRQIESGVVAQIPRIPTSSGANTIQQGNGGFGLSSFQVAGVGLPVLAVGAVLLFFAMKR